ELRRERLGELGMHHAALAASERRFAAPRVIDELLGHRELARAEILGDRADDVHADEPPDPMLIERPDVRAIVELVRCERALLAVAGDARNTAPGDLGCQQRARRRAVRRMRVRARDDVEAERKESAADDEAELAAHASPSETASSSGTPRQ